MAFLLREIPEEIQGLTELALDLRWTWSHSGDALWERIDPQTWKYTENPWVILQTVPRKRLEELARDAAFTEELQRLNEMRKRYLAESGWYTSAYPDAPLKQVAYFSLEYGLGEALPLYAGGLGILAGDHLKTASDLGVPVVGVGLLYQEGYFRQMLNAEGRQLEVYSHNDSATLPLEPMWTDSGELLRISLAFPGHTVLLRVWRARVGRTALYLLDSNDPLNLPTDQGITSQLYGSGREVRLMQEIVLGIGGWRALEALGIKADVCHLNEGHAAFAVLERTRSFMQQTGLSFWEALWATRGGNLLTTHTPAPAGFDTYSPALIRKFLPSCCGSPSELGVSVEELLALGRTDPGQKQEPFNMTYFALRGCAAVNGVSRLHGAVSRRLFQGLYPRWPEREVPVTHITNGVHMPSWDSPWADDVWTQAGGEDRWRGSVDELIDAIQDIPDEDLWKFCANERADLVNYVRSRLVRQLGQRDATPEAIERAGRVLDRNALTLGFARRFAEYKRPTLLLQDPDRLTRLLVDEERPVQLVVAGKAHPQDEQGKRLVEAWVGFADQPVVRERVVFLADYDIALAQELVQGADLWVNTPCRLWEACGTSGMKVLVNGGLNISELDGWWAEAYNAELGWALGDGEAHDELEWNEREADQFYSLLEEEIIPMFYDRDAQGIPRAWVARIRANMARLAPQFSSNRMVRDYVEAIYHPAAEVFAKRSAEHGRLARDLCDWESDVRRQWSDVHFGNMTVRQDGKRWLFSVQVYLGELTPDHVRVEIYADPEGENETVCVPMEVGPPLSGAINGYCFSAEVSAERPAGDFTPRVRPHHPDARMPLEMPLIKWQR
jgi:starch phosphorylase